MPRFTQTDPLLSGVLLEPAAAELLAHALGAAPHRDHLDAALAHLPQDQLTGDLLAVELPQGPPDDLGGGGVAELVAHSRRQCQSLRE